MSQGDQPINISENKILTKSLIEYIRTLPDPTLKSILMAHYSQFIPSTTERLNFVNLIPDLPIREKAFVDYINVLPFGQQRKRLIQTVTNQQHKSKAMQRYADFLPLGQQRKAYIKSIPDLHTRTLKIKQYQQLGKSIQQGQKINIDDYEFIAISKSSGKINHKFVKLISKHLATQKLNEFHVYQSNSEIGAWRYCRHNKELFFKGDDYISVTFIHFELQKYIHQVYDSLVEDPSFSRCLEITESDRTVLNSRIVKDPVFSLISDCFFANCFYNNPNLLMTAFSYSKKQQLTAPAIEELDQIKANKPYLENMSIFIQSINIYLQQFLNFDFSSFKPLYSYAFDFDNAHFASTIYEGSFVNNKNQQSYNIYINRYIYENSLNPLLDGTYSLITFIVPQDAKITENGIYSKVIQTGIYAYKALEYSVQMDVYGDQRQRRRKTKSIKHQRDVDWRDNGYGYYFIGDIMNQFWPLGDIDLSVQLSGADIVQAPAKQAPQQQAAARPPSRQHIQKMSDDQLVQHYNKTGQNIINQLWFRLNRIEQLERRVQLINKIQQKHSYGSYNNTKKELMHRFGPQPQAPPPSAYDDDDEDLYT